MRVQLRSTVVVTLLACALPSLAQVRVSITVAPPLLPVYEQPLCPSDGYIWTPGYWAWDDDVGGYYWVPGTWILPPRVGLLWTPGYWGWQDAGFVFTRGYWGPVVGFYGGIDYGFGYPGHGFYGGRWTNGRFYYNRSVSKVNVTVVHNTYVENVQVNHAPNRVSYSGKDGVAARPTAGEAAAAKGQHVEPTAAQQQHVQLARSRQDLHAAENKGEPPVLATPRPEALRDGDAGVRGGESSRRQPPNGQAKERSQGQSAPPQGHSEQPSGNDRNRSPQNGRPHEQSPNGRPNNDQNQNARPTEQHQSGRPNEVSKRSTQNGKPDEHAPAQNRNEAEPPSAGGRPQSNQDHSRNEQDSKSHEKKKRDKEPGQD